MKYKTRKTPMMADILRQASFLFGISEKDIKGQSRSNVYTRPRMAVSFLCKDLTGRSWNEIGKFLGGRDHSTIINAYRRCQDIMKRDPIYRAMVRRIRKLVTRQSKPWEIIRPVTISIPRVKPKPRLREVVYIAKPEAEEMAEEWDEITALDEAVREYVQLPERERWAA